MRKIKILGKNYIVIERKSTKDLVHRRGRKVYVNHYTQPPDTLLKEFLAKLLYSELLKIYREIKGEGKIDLFGNLEFEIVEKIDGKEGRIAKLKGNKIFIKLNAIALPRIALKCVVAHEIAHINTKRHTPKFWKTVQLICPDLKKCQEVLAKYSDAILADI